MTEQNNKYEVIALMSGTSLDGVDLCYSTYYKNDFWNYNIHYTETFKYPESLFNSLKNAINIIAEELLELDVKLSKYFSKIIKSFIQKNNIQKIDFIASHGHTVFHQPNKKFTLQIGCGATLATKTNIKVINDFRTKDVSLGGQGAPLVPIGDQLLFPEYDYCLNLGGIANISYKENGNRFAFDICPINMGLNYITRKHFNLEYDKNGELAKTGKINQKLFENLNNLEFYKINPPKSLGYEWFEHTFLPLFNKSELNPKDILATLIEHAAIQISNSVKSNAKVLITGGGAYNKYFISRLSAISRANLIIPNNQTVEFKEALIFGFLGVLRDRNEINCLSTVTGAKRDSSGGVIHLP